MKELLAAWSRKLKKGIQPRPYKSIDAVAVAVRRAGWKQKDAFTYLLMRTVTLCMICVYVVAVIKGVFLPPQVQVVEDFRLNTDYRDNSAPFTSLTLGQDGKLLLGSGGRGLHVYDTASGVLGSWEQVTHESTGGGLLSNQVFSLAASDQSFWVAAGGGLSSANFNLDQWNTAIDTSVFKYLDIQRDINTVRLTPDATTLFIGTNSDGVGMYATRQHHWMVLNTENENLFSDTIRTLEIGLGSVWVGTDKGLNVFKLESLFGQAGPARQNNLELENLDIRQIIVKDQDVWARTAAGGVQILRTDQQNGSLRWHTLIGEKGFPAVGQASTEIMAVAQIGKMLFVGTRENGVGIYDTETHDWNVYTESNGLWSDNIRVMTVFSQTLWVATSAGINSFDTSRNVWKKMDAAAGEDIVNLKSNTDDIWYVTASGEVGVYHVSKESWELVIGPGKYGAAQSSTSLRSLAVYQGLIWVASPDQGVGSYDTQKHSWQLRNDGLPSSDGLLDQVVELQVINGGLWCRAASGTGAAQVFTVYQWQDKQWIQASQEGQNVRAMVGDGSSVWFLLSDGSLIDQKTGQRYFDSTITHSIQFNSAVNIGGHELYLSSSKDGIWHYNLRNHNWQRLSLITGNQIHDVVTNDESIWYTTRNGGVGNYQLSSSRDQWVFPEAVSDISASSLALKTTDVFQGSFWFADENGRVYEYNPVNHIVQEHSDGLDFIQSAKDIQNLQIRTSSQSLWYFVTTRSGQQDNGVLYQYNALEKNWLMVSKATQNVIEIEIQDHQVWYRTAAGAVVNISETGKQQSYFSGTFSGLENITDIKVDNFGRIWFVSGNHGAAYYVSSTHSWRSVPISDTLTAITIVSGQSKNVQEAYITAATGLYHATLTLNKISDWKQELASYKILNLIADGSTLYAIAQQDGKGVWLFSKTKADWVPVIQDPWIGTDLSLHSELVYQDRLWGIGSDGNLWMYEPEQHQLKRLTDGSNKFTSLAVMDGRLWALSSNNLDNSYRTDIYEVNNDGTDYRLSHRYTASAPPQQLTIFANRVWQTNDQGLAAILTENGASQPIIGSPIPAFQQTTVREVILKVPKELVWELAIIGLLIVEVVAGWSWWQTRKNHVALMISAAILLVGLSIVYSYFYGLILDQRNDHHEIAATSMASSIVSFDDKVWIGSDQGVWQFSYNSHSNRIVEERYDSLGPVEELRVVENVLYAQLYNGHVKKYAHGWQDVAEIPPLQESFISDHWKVLRANEKVDIQLRESENTYHSVTFENGGFKHDQIRNVVMQGGDLWMATAGGVARYRPKEDGSGLTLIQIYGDSDGLPGEAVHNCTVAANHVVCMMDSQKLMYFEDEHWQPYSGNNPFDVVHTIYQFPSQDLALQANTKGEIIVPANLADAEHERFIFDHVEDLTIDAQGDFWVETTSGAWQWSASDTTSAPTWEFSPLTADVKQRFEAGRTRGNRQTWPIADSDWQWKRSVDPVTGQEHVQINFSKDPGIIRQFTPSRKFADQFIHVVWAEKPVEGKTALWLGTQSGIWKALYSPEVKDISTLELKSYYPVNNAQIEAFRQENGKLYAQAALADQALVYDPVKDHWESSSFNPFLKGQVILNAPDLGLLVRETAEGFQINPAVEGQGRFSFDIIQGIAAQPGFLWVATKDGVLQYKHHDIGLELVQHYSTADGLLSANVTGIKTDQQGNLFSAINNGQAYFRLSQDKKWSDAASYINPFRASKIRVENVPGLATWYFEGDRISVEFQGEPATFQNGVFDFDNVTDAFPEEDLLWLLTGHGILEYRASSPIEFQGYIPTGSIPNSPQKLARRDDQTFVRMESGSYYSWQRPTWQDQGACRDKACPFEYSFLQLQDAQWQTVVSSDSPLPHSLIRIRGIPANQIFDSGGKFSYDFTESIAVTASSAWLATRGGVVQFETQPGFLFKQLSTLDNRLPALNVSRVRVAGDQVMVGFVNDPRIFFRDPAHATNWKEANFKTDPFTVQAAIFENGNWKPVLVPENDGAPLIRVPGAPSDFQLFDISGKFSFDYVEKIQRDGSILFIQTRGGLLQAGYQDDRLVIQKISFNAPGPFSSVQSQIQFQLSDNPVDLELRFAPETGVQLWRDKKLLASYSNTEKYLGLLGSRVPIDSVVGVTQDHRRIYLITKSKLIIINKSIIERDLGPWTPNTPTPTLTVTAFPTPVETRSSTATPTITVTPVPSEVVLLPSPVNTALPRAIVLESSNVRYGPGMNYPIMISYVEGTELRVTGISQNGDWLRVILPDGREGWIHTRLVRLATDISLLPKVAESSATPTK